MSTTYSEGSVTLTNGSATVVVIGADWDLAGITGGVLYIPGVVGGYPVIELDENGNGVLAFPWPGATYTGEYTIDKTPSESAEALIANARLADIAARLRSATFIEFDASGTLAERAAYNNAPDGFVYAQNDVDPMIIFMKASDAIGDWTSGATLKGERGPRGYPGSDGLGDKYTIAYYSGGGRPGPSEEDDHLFIATVTFGANSSLGKGKCRIAPMSDAVWSFLKNGVQFATATFGAGDTEAVFAGSAISFVADDVLTIVAPYPRDATHAGVSLTLNGTR